MTIFIYFGTKSLIIVASLCAGFVVLHVERCILGPHIDHNIMKSCFVIILKGGDPDTVLVKTDIGRAVPVIYFPEQARICLVQVLDMLVVIVLLDAVSSLLA